MSRNNDTAKGGRQESAIGSRPDLAGLLSAVLNHPDTPANIYNSLQDSLNDSPRYDAAHRNVEFIRELLGGWNEPEDETEEAASEVSAPFVRCAGLIADLLTAPDTPEVLRSTLDNFCAELSNHVVQNGECVCSPETARQHLPVLLARAERGGMLCQNGGIMFGKGEEQ